MPLQSSSSIKGVSIPLLLEWWQQRKRVASSHSNLHATLPKGDETYLQAYYRLMEIYSVVKSGGVQTQTEAIHAFAERETHQLDQQIAAVEAATDLSDHEKQQQREKLEQELSELRSANSWRLQALTDISPAEEAIVKQYMPTIERTLMPVKCA